MSDDTDIATRLARRFHETYEQLAPAFNYKTRKASTVPWDEVPEDNRQLMIATVRVVLHDMISDGRAPQHIEYERNQWQRRVGVLLELLEHHHKLGVLPQEVIDAAHRVVNTDWPSGKINEPHGDIARLTVAGTLDAYVAAGLGRYVERIDEEE